MKLLITHTKHVQSLRCQSDEFMKQDTQVRISSTYTFGDDRRGAVWTIRPYTKPTASRPEAKQCDRRCGGSATTDTTRQCNQYVLFQYRGKICFLYKNRTRTTSFDTLHRLLVTRISIDTPINSYEFDSDEVLNPFWSHLFLFFMSIAYCTINQYCSYQR